LADDLQQTFGAVQRKMIKILHCDTKKALKTNILIRIENTKGRDTKNTINHFKSGKHKNDRHFDEERSLNSWLNEKEHRLPIHEKYCAGTMAPPPGSVQRSDDRQWTRSLSSSKKGQNKKRDTKHFLVFFVKIGTQQNQNEMGRGISLISYAIPIANTHRKL